MGEGEMAVSKEKPTQDLRSQLRDSLSEGFARHLSKCKSVSPGQCKRLSELLTKDSVSASTILVALTEGREEKITHD